MLWMMYNSDWDAIFSENDKNDIEYIGRLWSFRDPLMEYRLMSIVGMPTMKRVAALLGHKDYLAMSWAGWGGGTFLQVEASDVAYWMAMGGHLELLRDFISTNGNLFAPPDVHQDASNALFGNPGLTAQIGSWLWTAAALKNNGLLASKLVEWCVQVSDDAVGDAAYKAIGTNAADAVAEVVIKAVREDDGVNVNNFSQDVRARGLYNILLGCISAPECLNLEARRVFEMTNAAFTFPESMVYDLLEAAITAESPDGIWYLRYWMEEMLVFHDHSSMLSYVAQRAIELNDTVILEYIVTGAVAGDWELAEPMLWTACQVGIPSQVDYLLESGVPRSSRTYHYAMTADGNWEEGDARWEKMVEIVNILIANNVPLEDMYGSALLTAVIAKQPVESVERFIDLGCPVTFKVLTHVSNRETYDLLMRHIPEDRHAEYKDYMFYDNLSCDNAERITDFFDNFNWPVPRNFYYRCCMLDAKRTFSSMWSQQRFLDEALCEIEEGIAHHPSLCEYVWEHPHENVEIKWEKVIVAAIDQRKHSTLIMLERLMGPDEWRSMYDRAIIHAPRPCVPFPSLDLSVL